MGPAAIIALIALFLSFFCVPFWTWVEERRHFKEISFVSAYPCPLAIELYCNDRLCTPNILVLAVRGVHHM